MRTIFYALITIACLGVSSCRRPSDPAVQAPPIPIERIDLAVTDFRVNNEAATLDSMKAGLDIYLSMLGFSTDSIEEALTEIHNSPLTSTFGVEVRDGFPSTAAIESELGRLASILKDSLPQAGFSRVFGVISPYNQSVVIADSIVIIALNHYMGENYAAYASFPPAIIRLKTPGRIPIDVAEALIRVNYPFTTAESPTLLQRMIYEGAIAYTLSALFPDASAADILGITPEAYSETISATPEIWRELSSSGALYSSDPSAYDHMFSRLSSSDMPPYVSPTTGLQILKSYIANQPDTQLKDLLTPKFYQPAQTRLIEAKFTPGSPS